MFAYFQNKRNIPMQIHNLCFRIAPAVGNIASNSSTRISIYSATIYFKHTVILQITQFV